jgi:drug/metabolite transporter (DMT)-like permease
MADSPAAVQQEAMLRDDAEALAPGEPAVSPGRSWVRPVAFAVLGISLALLGAIVFRYVRDHPSLDVPPGASQVGIGMLAGTLALLALAVVVVRPERGTVRSLIWTSASWSVALLLGLILAWAAIATFERQDAWHGTPLQNAADLDAYLAQHVPEGIDPILIPTGILVQSLEFLNGDNVQVTGYLWQRLGPDLPDDLIPGVVLPEGTKDSYKQSEAYRSEDNGVETVGWYFETILREPFTYAEYPFDEQDLWVRLWARDFTQNTVLVPDFASYASLEPKSLPGLEKEFVYSGWTPIYAGFSLANQPYSTSFGIRSANQSAGRPEMYFNLILDRNFAGPFFEHMIFAIAVLILLFGLLVLTTDDPDLKARFQLSTAGVLGAASGLLFAVILKHNQLRSVIGSPGVSYIEVIPILLYGVIVVVVVNAILLASPYEVTIVHHRHNLVPVLAYWPVVLGLLFAVTLLVFFRS